MLSRGLLTFFQFIILFTLFLSGCEVERLYEVRLSDLSEANTGQEFRRDGFLLTASPSPGTDFVALTLIAAAEPRPQPDWTWDEFGNWPQARRDAAFSDWFDHVYLDVSVSSDPKCSPQVQQFDQRKNAQEVLLGAWRSGVRPVGRFREGAKGIFVEFPVENCSALFSEDDTNYAWVIADVRGPDGELLDTVRIGYRIELRETFVDWWIF